MNYFAYGQVVESDLDLGVALPETKASQADVRLLKCDRKITDVDYPYSSGDLDIHGRSARFSTTRDSGFIEPGLPWKIIVSDVLLFSRLANRSTIYYEFIGTPRADLLAFWFAHVVLPVHLSLEREHLVLHASSVVLHEQAVLFVGRSNAGKSTMANAFVANGQALLSDDKLAVRLSAEGWVAEPSHDNIRPYRNYEDLGNKAGLFGIKAHPISAVYVLERGKAGGQVVIEPRNGVRKFETLSHHRLYGQLMFTPRQSMEQLGELASALKVFTVSYPSDLSRLPEVMSSIETHNRGVLSLAAADQ